MGLPHEFSVLGKCILGWWQGCSQSSRTWVSGGRAQTLLPKLGSLYARRDKPSLRGTGQQLWAPIEKLWDDHKHQALLSRTWNSSSPACPTPWPRKAGGLSSHSQGWSALLNLCPQPLCGPGEPALSWEERPEETDNEHYGNDYEEITVNHRTCKGWGGEELCQEEN